MAGSWDHGLLSIGQMAERTPRGRMPVDMEAVVTRPAASAAIGTVELHICAPCWGCLDRGHHQLAGRAQSPCAVSAWLVRASPEAGLGG